MRVVLAGEESAGAQVLKLLLTTDHDLVGVLATRPLDHLEEGAVARHVFSSGSVWNSAHAAGLTTLPAAKVTDPSLADWLLASKIDLFLNVHSLHIACKEVVGSPRIGSFNLHPGPLPEFAGLNSASWAIYEGAEEFGVTLHWMEAGIDTGDIAYQVRFPISEADTALSLNLRCVREGLGLVGNLLKAGACDPKAIPKTPQDLTRRGFRRREVPGKGRVSWSLPAMKLERFVRACDYSPFPSPWGQPRFQLDGREAEIVKARAISGPDGVAPGTVGEVREKRATVACGDGWLELQLIRLARTLQDPATMMFPGMLLADGRPSSQEP